ncbi:MAG: phage head-tail connector protein [Clostridiales bacterium]|nr:phage head-tail connector protein [Clostridiales bacterium]
MTELEKLKKMTGESDEELLSLLLEDTTEDVLIYTRRKKVIPELIKPIRELAVISYNRRGTEGETSRSQGGVSSNFDNEQQKIYNSLKQYRLCKCGGKVFETTKSEIVPLKKEKNC